MALAAGSKLGPYEIVSALGAGGMGEVYRARDTRLDRSVAIKVLPDHLSGNSELRDCLDREARAISSLDHPNICMLYDVGRENGVAFLVMQYVEGQTFATIIDGCNGRGMPVADVLRYAIEIASGLDAAHRRGISHRDVKPANVMIAKAGA